MEISQYLRSYFVSSRTVLCSFQLPTRNRFSGNARCLELHSLSQGDSDETKSTKLTLNFQKLMTTDNMEEIQRSDKEIAVLSNDDGTLQWSDPLLLTDTNLESDISLDLYCNGLEKDTDESDIIFDEESCAKLLQSPHDLVADMNNHPTENMAPVEPPNMTIYHYKSTEETYFQWDYRNHPEVKERNVVNTLIKINRTLKDAHLEPHGKQRGVDTVRNNILNLDVTEKFRLGRHKSLQKGKISCKSTRDGVKPDYERMQRRMTKLLRPNSLLRSILKVIYERHAIYASDYTEQIAHLDPCCLGESFFGPETNVRVDYDTSRLMLRELWLHGHSGTFNKLQGKHNAHQERLKEKNYRPKLTD